MLLIEENKRSKPAPNEEVQQSVNDDAKVGINTK